MPAGAGPGAAAALGTVGVKTAPMGEGGGSTGAAEVAGRARKPHADAPTATTAAAATQSPRRPRRLSFPTAFTLAAGHYNVQMATFGASMRVKGKDGP